ncbi:MAG: L-threonylcarbamoyladenylate synthase [Candidatus Paceibacterota bacterium]
MMEKLDITKESEENIIAKAVAVLRAGGLVIFPTETVYGIGALATNQDAIDKLLAYKTRREGKPLSIAVYDGAMAEAYVEANDVARNLYENFLPGPITVVSRGKHKVAHGVESEHGTLGIRIPDYPLIRNLVKKLGEPITATSANASYKKKPYTVEDILSNISEKQRHLIDLILDAGELPKREPSTVVDTTTGEQLVLRQGDIKLTNSREKISRTPEETQNIARTLMSTYKHYLGYKSFIIALEGEMGAGKTEFTKGIAAELGIKTPIQSPTFIIEKEYEIETVAESYTATKHPMLYHLDTWRIADVESELDALGIFDRISDGHVFSVEWANKATDFLNRVSENAIIVWVKIEHGDTQDTRKITISDFGQ